MDNRLYGLLIGGAIAEAMGVVAELSPGTAITHPNDSAKINVGPGYWQEATTTLLALGTALFDADADAEKLAECFVTHLRDPLLTSEGILSNLDKGTEALLTHGESTHTGLDCGALIRTAAVALYFFNDYPGLLSASYKACYLTHQSGVCADACKLYASMLDGILHGHTKPEVLNPLTYCNLALTPEILSLFPITPESIEALSGSDHVVEGLKMVLHCFKKTNNYQEGLLLCLKSSLNPAPISALYGQLAGAYYGLTDIKSDWITLLKRPAPILNFAEKINKRIHI